MGRRYEIPGAFTADIKREPNGRQTVSTLDFVTELAKVNWNWSLHEANQQIVHYVTTFKDISPNEGENRQFMLYNPSRAVTCAFPLRQWTTSSSVLHPQAFA